MPSVGKMSLGICCHESTETSATAITITMTVKGRRNANSGRFIGQLRLAATTPRRDGCSFAHERRWQAEQTMWQWLPQQDRQSPRDPVAPFAYLHRPARLPQATFRQSSPGLSSKWAADGCARLLWLLQPLLRRSLGFAQQKSPTKWRW